MNSIGALGAEKKEKPEEEEMAAAFRCASSERHLGRKIIRSSYLAAFSLPHSPCQLVYVLGVDLGDIDQLVDGDILIGLVLDLLLVEHHGSGGHDIGHLLSVGSPSNGYGVVVSPDLLGIYPGQGHYPTFRSYASIS